MKTKKEIEKLGFKIQFTNGTGAGGQKRNRTYSVAVVTHIETGITQRCDDSRKAEKNMNIAFEKIQAKLKDKKKALLEQKLNKARQEALSKGTIRTYDYKRGLVKNHLTGKEASLKKVLDGKIDLINN